MKLLIAGISAIIIAILVLFTFADPAKASLWSVWKNANLDKWKTTAAYTVPASGLDIRVYEFTPKGAPHQTCVMPFSEAGPVGFECFDTVK